MKERFFAVMSGFFAGLSVYFFIGWIFTRKTRMGKRYLLICLLFAAGLVAVLCMRR